VVLEGPKSFAALEEEWDDLYRNSPLATPFQSWAWLYSWWESYGECYELRLVAVRDDEGLLVGLMPLMLERRMGFGRLLWIGTGLSDYHVMLVREGWKERVAGAAARALAEMRSWCGGSATDAPGCCSVGHPPAVGRAPGSRVAG
jgi:CelD/BcsL family acetyltransferase involved in cellulose biosynthesis